MNFMRTYGLGSKRIGASHDSFSNMTKHSICSMFSSLCDQKLLLVLISGRTDVLIIAKNIQALLDRTSGLSSPIVPQMLNFLFELFSYNDMLLSAQIIIGLGEALK